MINTSSIPAVGISLWVLGVFSVTTWALIFIKGTQSWLVVSRAKRFAKQFWAAGNLQAAADIKGSDAALTRLANIGFNVLRQPDAVNDQDLEHSWDRHELLERNLRQQIIKEKRGLDAGLALLATIGSTAPFVGLFGTVWGIMTAMHHISEIGNASIDVVAGPIGDALIATGIGIATAIPAVLAYNYFLRRVKSIVADLDDFAHDFINLAQRATYRIERDIRPSDARSNARHREFDRVKPTIVVGSPMAARAEQA